MWVSPLSGHSALPSRQAGDKSPACSAVSMGLVPDALSKTCLELYLFFVKEKNREALCCSS